MSEPPGRLALCSRQALPCSRTGAGEWRKKSLRSAAEAFRLLEVSRLGQEIEETLLGGFKSKAPPNAILSLRSIAK